MHIDDVVAHDGAHCVGHINNEQAKVIAAHFPAAFPADSEMPRS